MTEIFSLHSNLASKVGKIKFVLFPFRLIVTITTPFHKIQAADNENSR